MSQYLNILVNKGSFIVWIERMLQFLQNLKKKKKRQINERPIFFKKIVFLKCCEFDNFLKYILNVSFLLDFDNVLFSFLTGYSTKNKTQ